MGTDVTPMACHHRLNLKEPLVFFQQISNLYQADIVVTYYSYRLSKGPYPVFQLDYNQGAANEHLEIRLQGLNYLDSKIRQNDLDIDWTDPALIRDFAEDIKDWGCIDICGFKGWDPDDQISIYQEQVEFYTGERWDFFKAYFTRPRTEIDFSYLERFRREIAYHAQLLGCSQVIYFPDQGYGDAIWDESHSTAAHLMDYLKHEMEKNGGLCLDLPDFISHDRSPVLPPLQIFVVRDDFSDLKNCYFLTHWSTELP